MCLFVKRVEIEELFLMFNSQLLGSPSSPSGNAMSGSTSPNGVPTSPPGTSCCEGGRPLVTDPVTGQSVCSCQYDPARLTLSSYPRLTPYPPAPYAPPTEQNPYPTLESSAFYSPLVSAHYLFFDFFRTYNMCSELFVNVEKNIPHIIVIASLFGAWSSL